MAFYYDIEMTESIKEVKIPMSGKITDVLVRSGTELKEGDVIASAGNENG